MTVMQSNKFAKIVLMVFGWLLLFMGITTFIYPQIMTRYGLITETLHARLTVSAIIGGSEMGLGLFMLLGNKVQASISVRLWAGISIFCGIVVARLVSLLLANDPFPVMIYRELLWEAVIIILLFSALWVQRKGGYQKYFRRLFRRGDVLGRALASAKNG